MTGRWLFSAMFVLVGCIVVQAQERPLTGTLPLPTARPSQLFAAEPNCDPPVLLPVPDAKPATRKPCRSCTNEYNPNHVYLPEQSPDCQTGGCDGDCEPCRQYWFEANLFVGKSTNLPNVKNRFLYGAYAEAGYWFSEDRTLGLDLSFLATSADYHDSPVPASIASRFGLLTGDANLRTELFSTPKMRVDGLIGYRYLSFDEHHTMGAPGLFVDQQVQNILSAGQVGITAEYRFGPYFAEVLGKLAVGQMSGKLDRNFVETTKDDWCLMPTFGARVGYQLGESLWGTLGYQLLYISNFDRPNQPDTDYLLHGLTVGLMKRF